MTRKQLPAVLAALSIGMAASTGIDAATVLPAGGASVPMAGNQGVIAKITTATTSFFDEFEAGHEAARKSARYPAAGDFFAGPRVLVTGAADSNSYGMILASLGLMAVIVHRRRSM